MKKCFVFLAFLGASFVAFGQEIPQDLIVENQLEKLFPNDSLRREFSIKAFAFIRAKNYSSLELDPLLEEVEEGVKQLKSLPDFQLDNILDNFYHSNFYMKSDEKGYYIGYSREGDAENVKLKFFSRNYFKE